MWLVSIFMRGMRCRGVLFMGVGDQRETRVQGPGDHLKTQFVTSVSISFQFCDGINPALLVDRPDEGSGFRRSLSSGSRPVPARRTVMRRMRPVLTKHTTGISNTAKQIARCCDNIFTNMAGKPHNSGKRAQDTRLAPAYNFHEAARYLRLPVPTLRSWAVGLGKTSPVFTMDDPAR